jgi:YesN/AraC family two-component response regulator
MIEKNLPDLEIIAQADNGISAVEKSMDLKPDILLMDLKMPGLNGIDAIKIIRESNPETKIIIISAYDCFEYAKSALSLGVAEYLVKPVSESELAQALQSVVRAIDVERNNRKSRMDMLNTASSMVPILNTGIVHAVRNRGTKMIELLSSILGKDISQGYVVVGTMKSFRKLPADFCEYMQKNHADISVMGCVSSSIFLMLVRSGGGPDMEKTVDKLNDICKKRFHAELCFAASEQYRALEDIYNKFFQTVFTICSQDKTGRCGMEKDYDY